MNFNYLLTILCVFIWSSEVKGQVDKSLTDIRIYIISCASLDVDSPYGNCEKYSNYYSKNSKNISSVYKIQGDTLIVLDTLNYNFEIPTEFNYCRNFDEFKWIYFEEKVKIYDDDIIQWADEPGEIFPVFISILDYSEVPFSLKKIYAQNLNQFDGVTIGKYAYIFEGKMFMEFTQSDSRNVMVKPALNSGVEIIDNIPEVNFIDSSYHKYESGDLFRLFRGYPYGIDGKLKKSYYKIPFEEYPDYNLFPPKEKEDGSIYSQFRILYNTPASNYIVGKKCLFGGMSQPDNIIYIYNKNKGTWVQDSLKWDPGIFNVYNDSLIYGTCRSNVMINDIFWEKFDSINFLNRYFGEFGSLSKVDSSEVYFLFYDISTHSDLFWKSGDVDAEVLLIENGLVYYRIFDEIWRSKLDLSNYENILSDNELLVKNRKVIPNVHHLFIQQNADIEREYIGRRYIR